MIFILATSCPTQKVPVMSGQLKVADQTTASENHSSNQVILYTQVSFHFKETSLLSRLYQCIPANSLTSGANYFPADKKLCNYILLVFTKQEVDEGKKKFLESKISSHQFKIKSPHR